MLLKDLEIGRKFTFPSRFRVCNRAVYVKGKSIGLGEFLCHCDLYGSGVNRFPWIPFSGDEEICPFHESDAVQLTLNFN